MVILRFAVFGFAVIALAGASIGARADEQSGAQIFHDKLFGAAPPTNSAPTDSVVIVSGAEAFHARLMGNSTAQPTTTAENTR